MSTIRRTSARKAVEEASRSFRRALNLAHVLLYINCTRENSAIRVLANVLSKSLIRPKSRMIEVEGMDLVQMELASVEFVPLSERPQSALSSTGAA